MLLCMHARTETFDHGHSSKRSSSDSKCASRSDPKQLEPGVLCVDPVFEIMSVYIACAFASHHHLMQCQCLPFHGIASFLLRPTLTFAALVFTLCTNDTREHTPEGRPPNLQPYLLPICYPSICNLSLTAVQCYSIKLLYGPHQVPL